MSGTSLPFFLYPTGAEPFVVSGGYRSIFAFWMGGGGAVSFVPGGDDGIAAFIRRRFNRNIRR